MRGEQPVAHHPRRRLYTQDARDRRGQGVGRSVDCNRCAPAAKGDDAIGGLDQTEVVRKLAPHLDPFAH